MFNFFGTPCNISELQNSERVQLEYDWGPLSIWQEVDSRWYIYNAFLVKENIINGITLKENTKTFPNMCYILYENEGKFKTGKLSVQKLFENNNSNMVAFMYSCKLSMTSKEPYLVAFKVQSEYRYNSVLVTNSLTSKQSLNMTICVAVRKFTKKALFEFLSFHKLNGADSFLIYLEQNIPYGLIKLLRNFANPLNLLITFLNWNVPSSISENLSSALMEKDCQMRTKTHSKFSIFLHLNEYMLPLSPGIIQNSSADILAIKTFCLNHINKNRPIILSNFEAVDNVKFNETRKIYKNTQNQSSVCATHFCTIFRYKKCPKNVKTRTDTSMKAFSEDLTKSTLIQLLMNDDV